MSYLNIKYISLSACASYIQIHMYLFYLLADSDIAKKLQVLKQKYAKNNTWTATLFALMTDLKCWHFRNCTCSVISFYPPGPKTQTLHGWHGYKWILPRAVTPKISWKLRPRPWGQSIGGNDMEDCFPRITLQGTRKHIPTKRESQKIIDSKATWEGS